MNFTEKDIGFGNYFVLYGNSWAMAARFEGRWIVGFDFGYHCVGGTRLLESEEL